MILPIFLGPWPTFKIRAVLSRPGLVKIFKVFLLSWVVPGKFENRAGNESPSLGQGPPSQQSGFPGRTWDFDFFWDLAKFSKFRAVLSRPRLGLRKIPGLRKFLGLVKIFEISAVLSRSGKFPDYRRGRCAGASGPGNCPFSGRSRLMV